MCVCVGGGVPCSLSQGRGLFTSHRPKSCPVSQSSLPTPWTTRGSPTTVQTGTGRKRGASSVRQRNQSLHRKVSALHTTDHSPTVLTHNTRTSHLLNSRYVNLGRVEHTHPPSDQSQEKEGSVLPTCPRKDWLIFWRGVGTIRRGKGRSKDGRKTRGVRQAMRGMSDLYKDMQKRSK